MKRIMILAVAAVMLAVAAAPAMAQNDKAAQRATNKAAKQEQRAQNRAAKGGGPGRSGARRCFRSKGVAV